MKAPKVDTPLNQIQGATPSPPVSLQARQPAIAALGSRASGIQPYNPTKMGATPGGPDPRMDAIMQMMAGGGRM